MRHIVVFALSLVATTAGAQAPDATTTAAWAQTFLSGVTSLEARFQQDAWVPVHRRTTTSHGRLRIARPQRLRFDYEGSAGPIGIADGDDYLWLEPGDGTWPTQYTRGTNDVLSAALSVLVGGAPLERDFVVAACASTSATAPSGTTCVELVPRASHAAFERLRMYVRTAEDVRGRPARVAIELHDGTWDTFTFEDLHVNPSLDASLFTLEPPAGARPTPASR